MTSCKTIYVDMDDVLCETARRFLVVIEREFGKRVFYEQLTDFNLEQAAGLLPEERAKLYETVHNPEEILCIEPITEAIDVLRLWAADGYEIGIVTGRPPDTYEPSIEWLSRYKVPHHSFTIVDKYGRFHAQNTIGLTLSELAGRQFCCAVEDSLPMAQFLAKEMKVPVALLNRPWNRGENGYPIIARCDNWSAIGELVPRIAAP
jgi:uncharacterized HAD superfamily protein